MKKPLTPDELAVINAKPTLTPTEAAIIVGVSTATLYNQWKAGGGPASFPVGRARRIRRSDLDKWMRQLIAR